MDVSNEAILGIGGFAGSALCWWVSRVIDLFNQEVKELQERAHSLEKAMHELSLTVARIEASSYTHK